MAIFGRSERRKPEAARYWARYRDHRSWSEGEPPTTVIRSVEGKSGSRDESFRTWGGWAPTNALYDHDDPRPSTTPHLIEIDVERADQAIAEAFGTTRATRLFDSVIRVPKLTADEADSVRAFLDLAVENAVRAATVLDEIAAAHDGYRAAEFASTKSHTALSRQVAVLRSEGVPVPHALRTINDVIRFSVVLDYERYVDSTSQFEAALIERGFSLVPGSQANSWTNPIYKDYRSVWTAAPASPRIEIQFHTNHSLAAREINQHFHDYRRQAELWPVTTASASDEFVRHSCWWAPERTAEHERTVLMLLGHPSIEQALRDPHGAPARLAYLLGADVGDLRHLSALLAVLRAFLLAPPLPAASDPAELDALTASHLGAAATDAGDDTAELRQRAARLLLTHAIIARGDLDGRPAPATASAPTDPGDRGAVIAAVLGLPDTDAMRRDPDLAAKRFAVLTGIPIRNPTAVLVLATLLGTFVEDGHVPQLGRTADIVEETDRVAGRATPMDRDLHTAAAVGFDVPDLGQGGAGVYGVCSRAAVFLFKSVLIRSL
ncbi:hypothetical protein [Nocardia sp. NPDC057668]|uniref:hypothetical protein n=1 Tax=Nocardia sp. NPDC057668 TaxID=3346202 RepID=UPI00366DAE7E